VLPLGGTEFAMVLFSEFHLVTNRAMKQVSDRRCSSKAAGSQFGGNLSESTNIHTFAPRLIDLPILSGGSLAGASIAPYLACINHIMFTLELTIGYSFISMDCQCDPDICGQQMSEDHRQF
jgi:hypothetical protein